MTCVGAANKLVEWFIPVGDGIGWYPPCAGDSAGVLVQLDFFVQPGGLVLHVAVSWVLVLQ